MSKRYCLASFEIYEAQANPDTRLCSLIKNSNDPVMPKSAENLLVELCEKNTTTKKKHKS